MVSTRKKKYKSPPRIDRSPPNDGEKDSVVKKLVYHPTIIEKVKAQDCQPGKNKSETFSRAKKKNDYDSQNSSCDHDDGSLFVIDKTPSKSCIDSSPLGSVSESSVGSVDEFRFLADSHKIQTVIVKHDDSLSPAKFLIKKKTSNSTSITPDLSEDAEEEVYEINMSGIASAADDTIKLRMEMDTDELESDSSEDSDEDELIDDCQDRPGTSNDYQLNNKLDIDGNEDNQCMETIEKLFVIDKGPSHYPRKSDSELFVIDKGPTNGSHEASMSIESSSSEESDIEEESSQHLPSGYNLSSRIKCPINLENVSYINFNPLSKNALQQKTKTTAVTNKKVEELMKKSVLKPGFEKQQFVEPLTGKRQQKREGRVERAKTKGGKWYDMAAPEMTPELKNDLTVVQMRRALDPKRFYKGNDTQALPKYFQMGRVVETAADFYHARVPKKQRKANIVEELLADAEFRKYNKRKYAEIQEKAVHHSRGAYKHMKRLKKKKK